MQQCMHHNNYAKVFRFLSAISFSFAFSYNHLTKIWQTYMPLHFYGFLCLSVSWSIWYWAHKWAHWWTHWMYSFQCSDVLILHQLIYPSFPNILNTGWEYLYIFTPLVPLQLEVISVRLCRPDLEWNAVYIKIWINITTITCFYGFL